MKQIKSYKGWSGMFSNEHGAYIMTIEAADRDAAVNILAQHGCVVVDERFIFETLTINARHADDIGKSLKLIDKGWKTRVIPSNEIIQPPAPQES